MKDSNKNKGLELVKDIDKNKKNISKNGQNDVKNGNYKRIFNDFYDWLSGIQEDEPIPFEIKNIYFIIEFNQNDIVLSYSGDENLLEIFDYGFYSPLEGQYFDNCDLKEMAKEIFVKKSKTKKQVFALVKNIIFCVCKRLWFLKDKHIFYGLRFNRLCA